ncbi:MAG: Lactoylglutathione lyase and related lyases [uncultured Thermomicrobiales bacterium]|uniref:Lactoylglutathione lyase and related lyases n=1 Tax=uncultured Thermomicrobiales bacterium TaxID=1645740 RepID=A0A6J4UKE6_9BACT|nr:MAG: Lactoylglutathione lyase and related lyases [uncultured Thermomicrobiales bacterium]
MAEIPIEAASRRPVIDHVGVLVRDLAASTHFYAAALAPLGMTLLYEESDGAAFGFEGADDFGIHWNEAPTASVHVAFAAQDRASVDAFCAAALANGGREKGAPRIWAEYHAGYYAAFVWDPDGNNIEAVFHDR